MKLANYAKILDRWNTRGEVLKLMRFYDNAEQLIKKELPIKVRSQFYPFFESGFRVYNEIVSSNRTFFDSTFIPNIKGRLLTFLIFRQFEPDMISNNFPFKTEAKIVNNFKYKSLNLIKDNVIINVCKAPDKDSLPNKAKYKLKNCRMNRFKNKILLFDIDSNNRLTIKKEPYYVFLTYGYDKNNISFVNLMVPNSKMTTCLKNIDLKSELKLHTFKGADKKDTEKRLATLKEEAIKNLTILKKD